MTISLKTHKMLWGRAANRCAICRMDLVMDASETDDESIVGEACHIVAQSNDGPRGISDIPLERRDKYANLILLCNVHHKLIDDQPTEYSVERLRTLKADHERWVREQLSFDQQKQEDDEIYAGYVEEWVTQIRLTDWKDWTSWILSGDSPSISAEMKDALENVCTWLFSRVWPGRYPELDSALQNFLHVAQDFCVVFNEHAEKPGDDRWRTKKFYRIDDWNPELYQRLVVQYDEHVALLGDLILELTRAANYVCDMVRCHLIHSFRLKEGVALITGGLYMDLVYKTYRVEYKRNEKVERPYPGLEKFKQVRFKRDMFFGIPPASQQGDLTSNPKTQL